MIVRKVASRGFIFTFDDEISVYLIVGSRFLVLCDTHLGPGSMDQIIRYLVDFSCPDQMIIFNSHSDWDHIWGNCSFPDSFIIGHEFCKKRMLERGAFDLTQNATFQRGLVELKPPNLTFSNRLSLEDEDVEFFYAPGHTIDSAVCYDRQDMVLYIGDLAEDPIPYLDAYDLDTYLITLRSILTHPARMLVSAHSGIVTRNLIERNIAYITKVRDKIPIDSQDLGAYHEVHLWNINMRLLLEYEPAIRDCVGDGYSQISLLERIGDLHSIRYEDLKDALNQYMDRVNLSSI
ncbi:MAG: MBL fold metallo-hydrolase [Methanobacteriota archaeon]